MVVAVAERLQAVDARGFAGRRAVLDDLAGHGCDLLEALADLVEQPGPTGHRIPQESVHLVAVDVADDQDLQILHVHVEHAGRGEAQGLEHAVGGRLVRAGRQRQRVGDHVGVEADRRDRPAAALLVRLLELLALPVRGERRHALAADRADRVAEPVEALDRVRGADVDEAQPHAAAVVQALLAPAVGAPAVVLIALEAVDRDPHLEPQLFFVGDVRLVNEIDVADGDRLQHGGAKGAGGAPSVRRLDGLALGRDLEDGHLRPLLVDVSMEAPGDEAVAVGVDQVARHVLAQRHARRPGQRELHRTRAPEWDLGGSEHGAHFEPVARQEAFGREHAEGVHVVVAFGFAAGSLRRALEPLDERVAAPEQGVVLRLEIALLLAHRVEPLDLLHGPAQAALQARDDLVEAASPSRERGREALLGVVTSASASGHPCRNALST